MAKLNAKQKTAYAGLLHDIFEAGGIVTTSRRTSESRTYNNFKRNEGAIAVCKTISNEIKFREFNFTYVDDAINALANYAFYSSLRSCASATRLKSPEIAAILAYFCKTNEIYWDDINTHRTPEELEAYKGTIFGGALWAYKCFLSQTIGGSSSSSAPKTRTTRVDSTDGSAGPKNSYKASGPRSKDVRAILSTPGIKSYAGTYVFKITGNNAKAAKVKATAHIKPLVPAGAKGSVNKVFIGSANGYTDCTCYFNTPSDADEFLVKCKEICPYNISNLAVCKVPADKNGYFEVNTEFGAVLISACKLNEALKEEIDEVDESEPTVKRNSRFPEIMDIDVYNEAFTRE